MIDIKFADGIYFNEPHERAPDFVLGSLSIKPEEFLIWLSQQAVNEKGYVRLKVNRSKNGKVYVALDDWKPENKPAPPPGVPSGYEGVSPGAPNVPDEFDSDIPFMRKENV